MKILIAALVILTAGGSASAQEGTGRALAPSDTEIGIASDAVLAGGVGATVQRTFVPPYSGVVRVKFDVRSGNGTNVFTSAGVTHLSECFRPTSSTAFVTKVCNIRVSSGVPVTIYASPDMNDNTVELRNVRLYYRVIDNDGVPIIYEFNERV